MTPDAAKAEPVRGVVERYDSWTGRAWLEIDSEPARRVGFDAEGYAATRADLRARWPDRPWRSSWSDGRFPAAPFGWPLYPVLVAAGAVATILVSGASWSAGPWVGAAILVLVTWPLARLSDSVQISRRGLRVGPAWSLPIAWHDVVEVGLHRTATTARLWVRSRSHAASAPIPLILVPAVRARLRRLGALPLTEGDGGLDVRYAHWRASANGIPWGVLLGAGVAAGFTPDPWSVWIVGCWVAAGLGVASAAVEARATGWGAGAVLWLTVLYAMVLLALSFGPLRP